MTIKDGQGCIKIDKTLIFISSEQNWPRKSNAVFRHVHSTYPCQSRITVVCAPVRDTFEFPFCQRPWDLTKRRDDILVADMVADMAADMEVYMVADMEEDKVADMVTHY